MACARQQGRTQPVRQQNTPRAQPGTHQLRAQMQQLQMMSPQERQRLQERLQQQTMAAMARMQVRRQDMPVRAVRDNVTKAPQRGSTHNTHSSRQPNNSTQAIQRPIATSVRVLQAKLMSTVDYREASAALMQQHGWTTLPEDQQAIILFRDQVEQVLSNKQRSRKSRQRRREKRAHYRRQNAEQQGDY